MLDERAFVNGIVGLMATGGSTNHTLHLVAMARAAGILLDWDDFADLSAVTPLLARVYPNGSADVNQFHAAGGMPLRHPRSCWTPGCCTPTCRTVAGDGGLRALPPSEPRLEGDALVWEPARPAERRHRDLRPAREPFPPEGGLQAAATASSAGP